MKKADFIAMARSWIGTPYRHAAQVKGPSGGCDCVSFSAAIMKECGLDDIQIPEVYNLRADGTLISHVQKNAQHYTEVTLDDLRAGDVLMFRFYKHAQHLGIYTDVGTLIHATLNYGLVETTFDEPLRKRVIMVMRPNILED